MAQFKLVSSELDRKFFIVDESGFEVAEVKTRRSASLADWDNKKLSALELWESIATPQEKRRIERLLAPHKLDVDVLAYEQKRQLYEEKRFTCPNPPDAKGGNPAGSWTVTDWIYWIDANGAWDVDYSKLYAGKAIVFEVAQTLGAELTHWRISGNGLWHYIEFTVNGNQLAIGVSLAGIVSVNGKPFTQTGQHNDNADAVRDSIEHALKQA